MTPHMTPQEFDALWKQIFSKSIPLPHIFRQDYSSDWLRIKSFPTSKRYPTNDREINVLLQRQNDVITELLGTNTKIIGITGEYNDDLDEHLPHYLKVRAFQQFTFTELAPLNMHELSRSEFKPGERYRLYNTEFIWSHSQYNELLEDFIYDEARMFFMSVEKKCLIAPYDGGIDFIITDPEMKNSIADKFKEWVVNSTEIKLG